MYKTKIIEKEGIFGDGSYQKIIETELNKLEKEGNEIISTNFITDYDLFVIYKENK